MAEKRKADAISSSDVHEDEGDEEDEWVERKMEEPSIVGEAEQPIETKPKKVYTVYLPPGYESNCDGSKISEENVSEHDVDSTETDLNQLHASLLKAEMARDLKMADLYRRKIEKIESKKDRSSRGKTNQPDSFDGPTREKQFFRFSNKTLRSIATQFTLESRFAPSSDQSSGNKRAKVEKVYSECRWCSEDSVFLQHLVVNYFEAETFLAVPPYSVITEYECLIIPSSHVYASTSCDEEIIYALSRAKQKMCGIFEKKNLYPVFYEMYYRQSTRAHMVVQVYPLQEEQFSQARMYFKKAILEADSQWTDNKKLIEISPSDERRAITGACRLLCGSYGYVPKNMEHFCVEFGLHGGGYAHIIEDHSKFSDSFGRQVIAGILGVEESSSLFKKSMHDDRNVQISRKNKLHELFKS